MQDIDCAIINGYVVTMDAERRVLADGAVAVSGRDIVAVAPTADVLSRYSPRRTLDAGGAVVHPGFVECHSHLTLHLARGGFGDTISFRDVEPNFFVPYLNALDDEDEHAAATLACLEMIGNGTTCFLEAGTALSPAAVADAAERVGVRGLVADPFLWDISDNDEGGYNALAIDRAPADTQRALDLLGAELARNRDPDALVGGHIAIQGMGSASDELEQAAKAAADSAGTVLNQHQSYYQVDAETDDRRHGCHALVHLADIGVLGENCVFAHMNIIRDDELAPVVDSGMSIAWCPAGSMIWGVGGTQRGRHAELLRRGVNVALGSDSSNWANRFDIGLQGYLAVISAREKTLDKTALVAEDALEMATINGARAAGLEDRIGSLEPGKRADVVIRANDVPEGYPLTDPISQIVFSARSKSVHTVLIDGRVVLEARRPTRVDPAAVFQSVEASVKGVFDRMGYRFAPRWLPVDQQEGV